MTRQELLQWQLDCLTQLHAYQCERYGLPTSHPLPPDIKTYRQMIVDEMARPDDGSRTYVVRMQMKTREELQDRYPFRSGTRSE